MNTWHFYLSRAGAEVPPRWREAFPEGESIGLDALVRRLGGDAAQPGIVWMGTEGGDWPQRLAQLLQRLPDARVVLVSGAPEPDEGTRAFEGGVRGYTHAYGVPTLLQEVGLVVGHGGLWLGPDLLQRFVSSAHDALQRRPAPSGPGTLPQSRVAQAWASLTPREAEVARAVSAGRSNREVAELMFISERTVKAHLGVIFEKLGVRDRLQLVLHLAAVSAQGAHRPSEQRRDLET